MFKSFLSFLIITFFVFGMLLLINALVYFIDDYFISAKKAVMGTCIGILVLIADASLCYWVWG